MKTKGPIKKTFVVTSVRANDSQWLFLYTTYKATCALKCIFLGT